MADIDESKNQNTSTEQSRNIPDPSEFDAKKPNTLRSLSLPKFGKVKWGLPKLGFPKFKLPKPKVSFKKINFLWLWLVIILISYICMSYFLSVLLTIPARRDLAIAGFVIIALLPILTAFADYALMKWSYLISGFLIIGGLVFLVRLKFYLLVLAIIAWVGLTAIAFVGDVLSKSRKLWMAIVILTAPCLIGLGIGHQMWRLAASWS
ncbi:MULTISPECIES: hypothetical protein [Pseudanabaena]|jgi:hypothetical protein|uniref:hypothetical protein n=1 Tax=Pseudanabaena TaxID=1152 RepID=UPI00247B2163|nr:MULTISPECIES: hypothetical protein [Pseudanabaena]MEA5486864.1 hypothetical protein [Pseudanabaena sp. CCNP1317]WGS73255.1 hypothetical protein OA858_04285 [Pseudanabaena galeata CCNP1313]